MAADWIKIEHGLSDKPEVMQLAALLNIDDATVVGHLVRFWCWVDQNLSPDCPRAQGTKRGLDRVAGRDGFVDAMVTVGWLDFDGDSMAIPNYDHHLSESAKKRGKEAQKKRKQRLRPQSSPADVPKMSPRTGDKTGDQRREREEKSFLSIFGADVVIPERMKTDAVSRAYVLWQQHLDTAAPEKQIIQNSPQEQQFWAEASRMGPEKFVDAVQYTIANGWVNLRERPVAAQNSHRTPVDPIERIKALSAKLSLQEAK